MASYSISTVNQMDESTFVRVFGPVFEETPEIAAQAWTARPFQNIADLHQKMVGVVEAQMTSRQQLALIQAHPELGASGKMAAASVQEQAGVGLDRADPENQRLIQQIRQWNTRYQAKFGFPFVMAVKGQSLERIAAALEGRLGQEKEDEMTRSLSEIYKIARFRLDDLIAG